MAARVLIRPLEPREAKLLQSSFSKLLRQYRVKRDDARALIDVGESEVDPELDSSTLAALTLVANQLFNLDEVLNK